ncbi:3',5'-bisphosphate nucleotidase [Aureobasidium pullulans]|uniref:3'(2'),5'-bisphosphate nucleotidase n=1 Tax=Aureobasidium pullulans TaxID=5580 RepID=A0A4V4KPY4_AURPU|nr:3',5'-bisphosphate nucleotidase [Aureobasidium pullulans]THY69076.1 3',5'-bisphosphate nucleotidase [Aureobasidium pullulans]THZ40151.1 3',5'-bisphosphate nucleotidase [Aureobasidium pullulans]THZ62396.1 3',5'-bisphosphate nucleotidase [Aureobasidium pullulans]THZ90732.1 3',5'-bisphosphate nucleotidase [Aureobasidium pullulans]
MSIPFEHERLIAELAVQRASLLTKRVLADIDKGALDKSDRTPVTVADFGAQALMIGAIHHNFPDDSFIGEETATALRENEQLRDRVWNLVSTTHLQEKELDQRLGNIGSAEEMMDTIDLGNHPGGRKGRIWILDPIDGTATFMRNQQYAVCLALIVDGEQKVGVIGCPNLDLSTGKISEENADNMGNGQMLSAVKGQGAAIRPLGNAGLQPSKPIQRREDISADPTALDFVESGGSKSVDLEFHQKVAEKLGAPWPGTNMWSSQMRYIAMAVGGGDIMLRFYSKKGHKSYVWDHAGGFLIFEESGGKVTDLDGKPIDFGAGRRFENNSEMVAAPENAQPRILQLVNEMIGA